MYSGCRNSKKFRVIKKKNNYWNKISYRSNFPNIDYILLELRLKQSIPGVEINKIGMKRALKHFNSRKEKHRRKISLNKFKAFIDEFDKKYFMNFNNKR